MLGREIAEAAAKRAGVQILAWDRAAFDFTDAVATSRVIGDARPDVVIHAGAWTDVDGCEGDPARAMQVNGEGTAHVALACQACDARLVTVSTDYVFDGTKRAPYVESDATAPLSAYGRSKLAAEEATLALGEHGLVARTAWLYADHGRNFFLTMLRLAETQGRLRVVDDQKGSPTFAADLAVGLLDLAAAAHARRATGVYHVTNAGATTWNGFARTIFQLEGKDVVVDACTTAEFPRPAKRPANSVLADTRRAAAGLPPMPSWEDALARCTQRIRERSA
jgi:dTDP-4-dehydrorhamnose reductase